MYQYKATVTDVYDGDSITVNVDLGFYIHTILKLRLANIDAPEVRGEEREQGLIARNFLKSIILDKEVYIYTSKTGKYGRWIADIYLINSDEDLGYEAGSCVNEIMVAEGYAQYY